MTPDLQSLRFIAAADVYKGGHRAGRLERVNGSDTVFTYYPDYQGSGRPPIATTLPLTMGAVTTSAGGLPPFFAGLFPERASHSEIGSAESSPSGSQ